MNKPKFAPDKGCYTCRVRGSLGIFNLIDLIQLLASNQSKGLLVVHHPERGECKFFLEGGKLLHASFDQQEGIEALKALLEDERGQFEFLPNQSTSLRSVKGHLDNVLFQAVSSLKAPSEIKEANPSIPAPQELDTARIKSLDRIANLTLSSEEFAVVERIDGQLSAAGIAQASGLSFEQVQKVLTRLASLSLVEIKRREVRIAQLVLGLSRELTSNEACIDEVIVRTWERQSDKPVRGVRIREKSGREIIFPVRTRPSLGAYLLLSSNSIMQFDLQAGRSVLAKPEH